ncbi:MAG: hypothetical protein KME06_01505 [Kastovskya adunca ATA6-11-RM4]|jgi:hypothetical protein|nr:hypothetical protein [Kastovskya adunca ATA6-11-RM4]
MSWNQCALNPERLDEWFPLEQQRDYVSMLVGRIGFTRRRAEYFVRLWAYLALKQQQASGEKLKQPLARLSLPEGFIPCTHREAAELFYAQQDRGSDRAAGMMLDKLVALGLLAKQFDGNTICLQIKAPANLIEPPTKKPSPQFYTNSFNPKTDTIPVASFLASNYNWMSNNSAAVQYRITCWLRQWAKLYPQGMRVLRRCDTQNAVGFYILYPTAQESEENFFLPPKKSLHLSAATEIDPIQVAPPGDLNCHAVFVRSWMIDAPYMQPPQVCQLLEDTQQTLMQMLEDFPNLCDFYVLVIHPSYEELASTLGFQKIGQDPSLAVYWMYIPVERYLQLDVQQAVSQLEFHPTAASSWCSKS